MLLLISAVLLLFTGTEAFTSKDADEYLDMTLGMQLSFEALHNRIDPMLLQDFHVFVNTTNRTGPSANANYTFGSLHGMSMPQRSGNCSTPLWNSSDISFTCNITFMNNPYYLYQGEVTYGKNIYHIMTTGEIVDTKINVHITATPRINVPNLEKMSVIKLGDITNESSLDNDIKDNDDLVKKFHQMTIEEITSKYRDFLNGIFATVLKYSIYKTKIQFFEQFPWEWESNQKH